MLTAIFFLNRYMPGIWLLVAFFSCDSSCGCLKTMITIQGVLVTLVLSSQAGEYDLRALIPKSNYSSLCEYTNIYHLL